MKEFEDECINDDRCGDDSLVRTNRRFKRFSFLSQLALRFASSVEICSAPYAQMIQEW